VHPGLDQSLTAFPQGFHEDHLLRSEFLRRLFVAGRDEGDRSGTTTSIPKVLVRF
jgi:hypothetical protein